jgi:hypothetical protein
MKTITKLSFLSRLRLVEKIEFLGLILEILSNYNLKDLNMVAISDAFKTAFQNLERRYNKFKNPPLPLLLSEKDELRDNDIICLRMIAQAMTRYFDLEVKAAAFLLLETIDQYGAAIYRMNYETETAVLRNLINDLKTRQELMDAVKRLNVKALVNNLEKNNNDFRELYLKKVKDKAFNIEVKSDELLQEAMDRFREMLRTLESKAFLDDTNAAANIINEINALIQRHSEKLENRESRKEKSAEVGPEDLNEE